MNQQPSTSNAEYAARLKHIQGQWWKKILTNVDPYKRNLTQLNPGFFLDIGCGLGRNLAHMNGKGVGVDHNHACVDFCKLRGFTSFLPEEFLKTSYSTANQFDSILLAHVAEHMTLEAAITLIGRYLIYLKPRGKVILITPQERGQRSDRTHVEFMDFDKLNYIGEHLSLKTVSYYSYPFPRWVGKVFIYNEFIWVGEKTY